MKNQTQPLTYVEIALAVRIVTFIAAVAVAVIAGAAIGEWIWRCL